jgi:hypothetical protein
MATQSFLERFRPWTCEACGKKNISANKSECPQCYEPRTGAALHTEIAQVETPFATSQAPERRAVAKGVKQITRTYKGQKALEKGIKKMARQGWQVQSQSSFQPRAGVGRIVLLGIMAAVIKPQTKWVVVYSKI